MEDRELYERNGRGFVALPRAFFEMPYWNLPRAFSEAEAVIDVMGQVRYSESSTYYQINGRRVVIGRGEMMASYRYLARRWGWGIKKVRTFLPRLVEDGLVTLQKTQGVSVLRLCKSAICNFELVPGGTQRATPKAGQRAHGGHKTEIKGNNVDNKDKGTKGRPKNRAEFLDYARSFGIEDSVAEDAFDYYEMVGWVAGQSKAPVKDWKAAARAWKRRAEKWKGNGNENDRTSVRNRNTANEGIECDGFPVLRA